MKKSKSKSKLSMIIWIITNKNMSFFRKFYKANLFLHIQIGKYFRHGSQCNLLIYSPEQPLIYDEALIRRIALLTKKGYIVQIIEL
jgi:hypothetical protein